MARRVFLGALGGAAKARECVSLCLALGLLTLSPVYAQFPPVPGNVGNKIKTKISKAKTTLARAERDLKDAGELFTRADDDKRVNRPEELARIAKYLEKSGGWLKEVDELMEGLPEVGEIGDIKKRSADAQKMRDEFQTRLDEGQKKSLAENATLEEGMKKDKKAVDALIALAEELRQIQPSSPSERIAQLPQFERDAQRFVDTYGNIETVLSEDARMMRITGKDLKNKMVPFRANLAKLKEAMPRYIATQMAEVENDAKAATTQSDFMKFYLSKAVKNARLGAKNYQIMAPAIAGADLDLPERTEKRLTQLKAEVDKAAEKAIAKNQPLPDTYAGSDRDALASALKNHWKSKRPSESVIGVRLFDSWDRRTAWEWSDSRSSWEKSDASRMQAAVLVKSPDGKYAYQRYASLVRDHLNGGQLVISTAVGDTGRPASPFEIIPVGNIK